MIFLIEYDRRLGRLINLKEFEASARPEAEEARFERELALLLDAQLVAESIANI
jgi:hypothetical protein